MAFELIKFAKDKDLEAIILSLDFKKCFDKVSFSILFGALEFFKFPKYITKWVKILYTNFKINTQNNGFFSGRIDIQQGLYQGGPCSSLLFLICAEILALMIKENKNIKGIWVDEIHNLFGQYADDADAYLLYKKETIDTMFMVLEIFRAMSGFTLNYDKTTIMRIGSMQNSVAMLMTKKAVVWTNNPINILGVWVSTNKETVITKNYTEIIQKARVTLTKWNKRRMSLYAKIAIVNTLISSLFVYRMTVLPHMPAHMEKELKNLIVNFIWNGARPKISYEMLILPKNQGGAGLVDILAKSKALKVSWINILQTEAELARVVYANCAPEMKELIWECNLDPEQVRYFIKDEFWADVLSAWFEFKKSYNVGSNCQNELLWLNSQVQIDGKPIFWKKAFSKGLIHMRQLFKDGEFMSHMEAKTRFDLSVLSYNAIKSAIPLSIKNSLKRDKKMAISFTQMMKGRADITRVAYKALIKVISFKPLINKWEQDLQRKYDMDKMMSWFNSMYVVTNIPKLRSFQFRLLHRAIITNIQLAKWGMKESNKCTFCEKSEETYMHLFVMCDYVQELWIKVEEMMMTFNCAKIHFNVENVLFNSLVSQRNNVKNFICLLTKQYIYRQQCYGQKPNYNQLSVLIYEHKNIEKYIATKNNKIGKYVKKWCNNSNLSYYDMDIAN